MLVGNLRKTKDPDSIISSPTSRKSAGSFQFTVGIICMGTLRFKGAAAVPAKAVVALRQGGQALVTSASRVVELVP